MFTGIVQAMGTVAAVERNPFGLRLVIDRRGWRPPGGYVPAAGDSICVSGVCLTVVDPDDATFRFDVIAETLAKTTLGSLKPGDRVNLEPALTANAVIGGHFLQGHVDGVGTVAHVHAGPDEWRVTIAPPAELMDYIIPKGSIAIAGVSLTIAAVGGHDFQIALIPTTLKMTTMGGCKPGDAVNLETDILARTMVHYLKRITPGLLTKSDGSP